MVDEDGESFAAGLPVTLGPHRRRLEGPLGRRLCRAVGRQPLPRGDLTDAYPPAGVSALPQVAQRPRPWVRASATARAKSRSWATFGGNG
jgi:hypothetical protein